MIIIISISLFYSENVEQILKYRMTIKRGMEQLSRNQNEHQKNPKKWMVKIKYAWKGGKSESMNILGGGPAPPPLEIFQGYSLKKEGLKKCRKHDRKNVNYFFG